MNTNTLVERESELALFENATERLDQGLGGVVLVSGEAGIGKTSLIEESRRVYQSRYKFHWSVIHFLRRNLLGQFMK